MLTISKTLEDQQAACANTTHAAVAAFARMRSNWLGAERQSVGFSAESLLSDQELIERLAGDDPEGVATARTLLGVGEGVPESDETGH